MTNGTTTVDATMALEDAATVRAVEVNDASLTYAARRRTETDVHVLDGCRLSVRDGEFVALIGPSGCGKSTLLHAIAGLTPLTSGSIRTFGDPVRRPRSDLGYMFQQDTLLPWANVLANVRLPMDAQRRKDDGACLALLEQVGVAEFKDRYPRELSGGMRQRVQLARVLAQRPRLLLMDEPFGALDAQTKLLLQDQFLDLWESSKITALFVTHDLAEAIRMADRIVLISHRPGKVRREWQVPLDRPRPRIEELATSTTYQQLFADIWKALRTEISDE